MQDADGGPGGAPVGVDVELARAGIDRVLGYRPTPVGGLGGEKEFPGALDGGIGAVASDAAECVERLAGRECFARLVIGRPAPAAVGVLAGEQFGREGLGAGGLVALFTEVVSDDRVEGERLDRDAGLRFLQRLKRAALIRRTIAGVAGGSG